jgi:hypothetical protein
MCSRRLARGAKKRTRRRRTTTNTNTIFTYFLFFFSFLSEDDDLTTQFIPFLPCRCRRQQRKSVKKNTSYIQHAVATASEGGLNDIW